MLTSSVSFSLTIFALLCIATPTPRESEELVELLLEAGADPFAIDEHCHTYLHFAAAFDLPRSIRALAARGVDVNMKVIIWSLMGEEKMQMHI